MFLFFFILFKGMDDSLGCPYRGCTANAPVNMGACRGVAYGTSYTFRLLLLFLLSDRSIKMGVQASIATTEVPGTEGKGTGTVNGMYIKPDCSSVSL